MKSVSRSWQLDDVEVRAREHPATFQIPEKGIRERLLVGWYPKLIFVATSQKRPAGERMWVRVVSVRGEGLQYQGVLASQPVVFKDLDRGESIEFEPRHVADYIDGVEETTPRGGG